MPKIKVENQGYEVNVNAASRKADILTQALEKMIETTILLARSEGDDSMEKAMEFHATMRPHIREIERILEKYHLMEEMILSLD